jgi:ergothioneine biosynthesis protein EgtB
MERQELSQLFKTVRQKTEDICSPLEIEDYMPQPTIEVSPPRWHLAHTTWFFESFVLQKLEPGFKPFHPAYGFMFNSYYQSLGERWEREKRGWLSRPTVKEIYGYRHEIDHRILQLIEKIRDEQLPVLSELLITGINHEQQHQELLVTDLKYILAHNPMRPVYNKIPVCYGTPEDKPGSTFEFFEGNLFELGHTGKDFCFDNEQPSHKVFVRDFRISSTLVTNAEYMVFMESGGYQDFRWWLDEGWKEVCRGNWEAPLYWHKEGTDWYEMTLNGFRKVDPDTPVTHISYYEADAFARWAGKRLPTEAEWEYVAKMLNPLVIHGNFLEKKLLHPFAADKNKGSRVFQLLGDVWEWTSSAHLPYDGYKAREGAIGEYNGKFMINQMVLRGGSCATPQTHIRHTYRNFFHPEKRWQFTGIRLAESANS